MLAKLSASLPLGDGWAFEVKWDGIRAIAYIEPEGVRLESRNGNDITAAYPELEALADAVAPLRVVLDGEIVAFDEDGRPSFERLQRRMGVRGKAKVHRLSATTPVQFMIFDLLRLDGRPTGELPYEARRKLLETLELAGQSWRTPNVLEGETETLLEVTEKLGLEGVVAKRKTSLYEPGKRTGAWLKVKNHRRQQFVVGGWIQRENAQFPTVGALVLGYFEPAEGAPRLRFAGRVGTGLTVRQAGELGQRLKQLETEMNPFENSDINAPGSRFVKPKVVVDVEFTEWTNEGVLRHPSLKGFRPDIPPEEVSRQ